MDNSAYSASIVVSLSSTQRTIESYYIPSSTQNSNMHQHSQMSATQFANSIGQASGEAHVPIKSWVNSAKTPNAVLSEESGVGLAVPFQANGNAHKKF